MPSQQLSRRPSHRACSVEKHVRIKLAEQVDAGGAQLWHASNLDKHISHSHNRAAAGCMEWLAGRPSFLSRATRGLSGQAL